MRLTQQVFTRLVAQLLLSLAIVAHGGLLSAQTNTGSTSATAPAASTTVVSKPVANSVSKPLWNDLTDTQKQALAPLTQLWPSMTEPHKRKWLAISQNFSQLSQDEQNTVQGRMREWAALSQQQRAAARLNFANSKELLQEDKKAKWEAYQALSPEAKQKLAAQQAKPVAGAAPAVKPIAPQKLATPPAANDNKPLPRIASDKAAPLTLLPNRLSATNASVNTPVKTAPAESSTNTQ